MTRAYVSLGSNIRAEANICSCTHHLRSRFKNFSSSDVYQSPAIGFEGDPFLNSVVGFDSDLDITGLRAYLRDLETIHGRVRSDNKYAPRTLDLDLLLFGSVVLSKEENLPHKDILQYAFVLYPLAEIAPEKKHPVLRKKLSQLAEHSQLSSAEMTPVTLRCR